jgi:outer membrane protein assembly factor BamB
VADGAAVFGGCDAVLRVVSLADGKELKAIDAGAYVAASPALADGRAYVGNYEGRFLCADVNTGEILWTFEKENVAFYSSPAVSGSAVVVGARDQRLHCLDRASGAERWALRMRGDVDSSPAVCGDKVVVGSNGGWVVVVRMSDGVAVWSFEIGEAVTSSPAVAGGRIVVGSEDGAVYAFGAKP